MKKKLLLLTGALTVAALSVAIFAHKPMTAEEALLLKNVEAIAQNEGGGDEYKEVLVNTGQFCRSRIHVGNGHYVFIDGVHWDCKPDPNGSTSCSMECRAEYR